MRQEIRTKLRERRETELSEQLNDLMMKLAEEGYTIAFGQIGNKTTYALLVRDDEEILGYTFIKDIKYKNDLVGRYKALQQAVTRKSILESQEEQE